MSTQLKLRLDPPRLSNLWCVIGAVEGNEPVPEEAILNGKSESPHPWPSRRGGGLLSRAVAGHWARKNQVSHRRRHQDRGHAYVLAGGEEGFLRRVRSRRAAGSVARHVDHDSGFGR